MRVLQLCHKPPFPAIDGGCLAMHTLTCGLLAAGHHVKVLTAFTHKHDLQLEAMSESYKERTDIEGVFIDTEVNMVDAFSSLITQDSYNISRFFSTDLDIRLARLLRRQKFDVVHIESLFMTPYLATIRRHSRAPIVLRSHNLEYIIWERMAEGARNPAKRTYLRYLSRKLKEYELSVLDRVDAIAAISQRDLNQYAALGCRKPLISLPFGIDAENYPPPICSAHEQLEVFHIGAMDWQPNLEAIDWLTSTILPLARKQMPELKVHLAGRKLPLNAYAECAGIVVHGEVESAIGFMADHDIMVVPLRSAGGIRVKIIEAMACGKVVITTSTGAEGIDGVHGTHFIIADTAEAFAAAMVELTLDRQKVTDIGKAARALVLEHFNNGKIIERLTELYRTLQ